MSSQQDFARTVLAAFEQAGHYTDREIGDAGGPSTTTLTGLRKVADGGASMSQPRSDTFRKMDRAAKWEAGSARALWNTGRRPVPAAGEPVPADISWPFHPRMAAAFRSGNYAGIEPYVVEIADRLLEIEERVNRLEEALTTGMGLPSIGLAADEDQVSIEEEQEETERST